MITLFNRKELRTTFDMKKQAEIRQKLEQNSIEYNIKVVNRKSSSPFAAGSRAHTGTFGESPELAYEYIIFVKKSDWEKATHMIMN